MDERPKRRKHRDNPYVLLKVNEKGLYKVSFKDGIGVTRVVDVTKEVYEAFDEFELQDIKELNEYDRHIEHSEIYENNLEVRAMDKPVSLEEVIETKLLNEDLKMAINSLSDIQKRRIKMYYFEDKTLREIAEIEHCKIMSVKDSIDVGIKKIKKILNYDLKN